MLEIVLLILKIAGVIFASVLGILIVLICMILFVPVRYRGDFSVSGAADSEKPATDMKLRATWFLQLVRVYVTYEESLRVRLKLLFFTLKDTAKKEKAKRKKKEKQEQKEKQKRENKKKAQDADSEREGITEESEAVTGKAADSEEDAEVQSNPDGTEENKTKQPEKRKKSIKFRISDLVQTSRKFCDKLKELKKKGEKIENLWTSAHLANSKVLLVRLLSYLLKHTKPKKLSGYLRFGFDDPSVTGYIMAVYGILYPIWSPELSVEPDFEDQVLDCHILLKGKIRVWHIVWAALRIKGSKDVRRVIEDVRNF